MSVFWFVQTLKSHSLFKIWFWGESQQSGFMFPNTRPNSEVGGLVREGPPVSLLQTWLWKESGAGLMEKLPGSVADGGERCGGGVRGWEGEMRRQSAVQETGSDHILLWPLTAQLGAAAASSGGAADIQAHTLVSHNPLCVCVCRWERGLCKHYSSKSRRCVFVISFWNVQSCFWFMMLPCEIWGDLFVASLGQCAVK